MRALATVPEEATGEQVLAEQRRLQVASFYEEASVVDPFEGTYPPGCTLTGLIREGDEVKDPLDQLEGEDWYLP